MHYVILGGAGFVGSHLTARLLQDNHEVTSVDTLVSGTRKHIQEFLANPNFIFLNLDVTHSAELRKVIREESTVIHLASNPDIAAAATSPRIDFTNGTVITESALEATRLSGAKNFIYASGSGVYRENYTESIEEDFPVGPISTYGASKLAGESLASAYSFMFGIRVSVLRFANVVGPHQTHGVGYDFLRKLKEDSSKLIVRGDGNQRKAYIHVIDVVTAMLTANKEQKLDFDTFNVSVPDSITVKDIAALSIHAAGLRLEDVEVFYEKSNRGWIGDVPIVSLNSNKLRALGWRSTMNSTEAIADSLSSMWGEITT
jgi:UDP-glucose 4-epimerase